MRVCYNENNFIKVRRKMKRVIGAMLLFFMTSAYALDFDIGVSGRDDDVDGFYFSIGNHYNAPREEIYVVERRIPRDEVNIAYFLARESRRDINFITDLRLRGRSWWDISLSLGLNPRNLYVVETYNHYGPPYGRAYGYTNNKHRLSDREIVELVNVRFLSRYHGISPDEVIERRQRGSHYYRDKNEYREKRHKIEERQERREERHVKEYKKQEKKEEKYKNDK
jgi:hypothetical protein